MGTPIYRQEQYWKSQGIDLNRTTMANWITRSSNWIKPLFELMMTLLLKEAVIHADKTVLRVLKRNGKQVDSQSRSTIEAVVKLMQITLRITPILICDHNIWAFVKRTLSNLCNAFG